MKVSAPHRHKVWKGIFGELSATKCFGCKSYFRFERMWRFILKKDTWGYMCFGCASSEIEVCDTIDRVIEESRPKSPPPSRRPAPLPPSGPGVDRMPG